MTDTRTLVIGVLAIAVLLLGYQYYEQQQRTIKIELPKVEIGKP
jgi:predicted negative regulator of RcsB-dependent stress response